MSKSQKRTVEGSGSLYVTGAIVGMGLGLFSAHMYKRAIEENAALDDPNPLALSTSDTIKMGLLLLGAVRGIAELASSKNDNNDK